jgi:glutamate/tyrosine decarboxylase-like PLP-dependent enzyme
VVVRDPAHQSEAFDVHPSYTREDKELTGRGTDLMEYGPQFSRGFPGLKVWVSLLAHGWSAYCRRIEHDVELARYLHRRVIERPEFEPMAPEPPLSIACFRYVPEDMRDGRASTDRDAYLDRLNERLMSEIQMDGRVFPSNAVLDGRYVLRACIVNFRTEAAEVDRLLEVAAELGARLDAEMRAAASAPKS